MNLIPMTLKPEFPNYSTYIYKCTIILQSSQKEKAQKIYKLHAAKFNSKLKHPLQAKKPYIYIYMTSTQKYHMQVISEKITNLC